MKCYNNNNNEERKNAVLIIFCSCHALKDVDMMYFAIMDSIERKLKTNPLF